MTATAAAKPDPATLPLPELRPDLRFYPSARTSEGAQTWVIYDASRYRYFSIGRLEFELLRRWRVCNAQELARQAKQETSMQVSPDTVLGMASFLSKHELLRVQGPEANRRLTAMANLLTKKKSSKWLFYKYLFFRVPLFRPDAFLSATLPLIRPLINPLTPMVIILLGLLGVFLVSRQWDSFINTLPYLFSLEGLLAFAITLSLVKVAHELGHAYACKYFGLEVPNIGVAFMLLWPVMYTDCSNAWKLTSRRQRLWIDSAGMMVELMLAALATLLWNFLPDGPLRSAVFMIAAVTWIMTVLINFSPFMRFDGYYILSDLLNVSNLQDRSFALARWKLREWLFALGDPAPEHFPPQRQRILLLYAYSTWIYRLLLFFGIALVVYFMFFKVLGIFLLLVEIGWFIVRPIALELVYWHSRRGDLRWNFHTTLTAISFTLLIALLFIPWRGNVHAPALYQSQEYQRIYPPAPGRITEIHIQRGQKVQAGDLLFTLQDPEIQHDLESAQRSEQTIKLELDLQSADQEHLERARVLQNQLAETQAKIKGAQDRQARLRITAPLDGQVADMDSTLQPGRWVNEENLLALLNSANRSQVTAYLSETDISEIAVGKPGRFYPDTVEQPPFDVEVAFVDAANIPQLEHQDNYVASVYQGQVAARLDTKARAMIPEKATYRVKLALKNPSAALPRVYPGNLVVETVNRRSFAELFWTWVAAVLVRESGF